MANCGGCDKKLSFFQTKYDCEDNSGIILKCCSECYEKFQRKETISTVVEVICAEAKNVTKQKKTIKETR